MRLTVPCGEPVDGAVGLIVAVKVTLWPKTTGVGGLPANVVVVGATVMVYAIAGVDALAKKFVSPLYCAVIE